jgi:hypothetical protein
MYLARKREVFQMTKNFQTALIAALMGLTSIHSASAQDTRTRTVSGTVVSVVGIGGESTGTAIEQDDGRSVEVDFSRVSAPAEGTEVRAQGFFTTVLGVAIPSRKVFVVTALQPPGRVGALAVAQRQTVLGKIETVLAGGGETTGTVIRAADGRSIEADFSRLRLGSRLPEGRIVEATGTFRTVVGTETPTRQVFTVQFFLVQLDGVLTTVRAIGGETTGTALRLANGEMVEIDLRKLGMERVFRPGARARVLGMFKSVPGVEIPMRQVLIVSRIGAAN